jgi:hypothetical protein
MNDAPIPGDDAPDAQPVKLAPAQLRKLSQAVAVAVLDAVLGRLGAAGRSSFSITEVAQRAGLSEQAVRDDVHAGRLRVVRPGGRSSARVMPEDELLWLSGRRVPADEPCEGIAPRVAQQRRVAAVVGHVLRPRSRRVRST